MASEVKYPNDSNQIQYIDWIEWSLNTLNNKDFSTSIKQTDWSQKTQIVWPDWSVSKVISNWELRVSNKSYLFNVAQWNIVDHEVFFALGYNPDVDNVYEDIVEQSINYIFPTTWIQMKLVSTSTNDNWITLWTWVRTVHFHYLDSSFNQHLEIITLNWTTPVLTTATNIYRIQKLHTVTAWSLWYADWNIIMYDIWWTINYAQITALNNYCRNWIYTVPAGKIAYITGWDISIWASSAQHNWIFSLKATADHAWSLTPWVFQDKRVTQMTDWSRFIPLECPIRILAWADIKVTARSDTWSANAIVTSFFEWWLENA